MFIKKEPAQQQQHPHHFVPFWVSFNEACSRKLIVKDERGKNRERERECGNAFMHGDVGCGFGAVMAGAKSRFKVEKLF